MDGPGRRRRSRPSTKGARLLPGSASGFTTASLLALLLLTATVGIEVAGAAGFGRAASPWSRPLATSTPAWSLVHTGAVHPPPLAGSSIAYDPKDGYVVLFGGYSGPSGWGSGNVTNATWSYSAGVWTHLYPAVAPHPRAHASIAYDPVAGALVLFGGAGKTTCSNAGCSTPEFNDTWTFVGGTWTHLGPARSPPARFGAGLAFDPKAQSLILVGGITNGNASDTWKFSGGTWTHIAQNCTSLQPPWGRGIVSTYDRADGVVVALNVYGPALTFLFSKGCWTQYSTAASPTPAGAVSFDPRLNQTVFFTGNSTWGYSAGVWGGGLAAHSPPDVSYEPIVAFDAADRGMLLFGAGTSGAQTWILR